MELKGCIYYTDNRLEDLKHEKGLAQMVREHISASGLPILSVSLERLDFGENYVYDGEPGALTMYNQILCALKLSRAKYAFFCEHDVLYHPSHFQFTPPRDDTFYYNTNVWRCHPRKDIAITYDDLRSVSGICVHRKKAIQHYEKRVAYCYEKGFDKLPSRNPKWARVMGYEPGKPVKSGGFIEEKTEVWRSEFPNVDIRHYKTMTTPKIFLEEFVHKPKNFFSGKLADIPGWDIKSLFKLK